MISPRTTDNGTCHSRKCGYCREPGHNRRTCPSYMTTQLLCQSWDVSDARLVGWKQDGVFTCTCENCLKYQEYNIPTPELALKKIKARKWPKVTLINKSRSVIYLYHVDIYVKMVRYIDPGYHYILKYPTPFQKEELDNYMITDNDYNLCCSHSEINPKHIRKLITIEYGTQQEFTFTDKNTNIMDQWKEAALKSHYLLKQLERLGANQNPNYEPIMDMIQDINYPDHDEQDKERAGVSSAFTNITAITGVEN